MSTEDSLGAKIKAKIQWHHAEVKRLQAIIDEFEGGQQSVLPILTPAIPAPPPKPVALTGTRLPSKADASSTLLAGVTNNKFLAAVRNVMADGELLTSREIADRLKAYGWKSRAKDYYPTIYNQLVSWAAEGKGVEKVGDRTTGVRFRKR